MGAKGRHWKLSEESRRNISLAHLGIKNTWQKKEVVKPTTPYRIVHYWIQTRLGKPHYCEHCKKTDLPHRSYNWANVSKQYKRELSDWIRLCIKCHKKYDKK